MSSDDSIVSARAVRPEQLNGKVVATRAVVAHRSPAGCAETARGESRASSIEGRNGKCGRT